MAMDKFAVEEREEDLGNGDKLVKKADGSAHVKTANGREIDVDLNEGAGMVKSAGLNDELKAELENNGYKVER